jgi:thiol-disulfide isomerase/thioredoxin
MIGGTARKSSIATLLSMIIFGYSQPGICATADLAREGDELLGKPAPELQDLTWLNSPALSMKSLRGHVVLIRFWLIDCPYCKATAPALNYLHEKYANQGLVVIGVHHPKSDAARNIDLVRKGAAELGFKFPVATDDHWTTVNSFWLANNKRTYTSATFLIDKQGKIRWIHPGGEIRMEYGSAKLSEFENLEREIQNLLSEK